MATNTSKTRHIAALDFDISKAEQQLAELQQKIEKVSAELAGKNWTVKAIIEGTDGFGEARQELSALNEKFDTLLQKVEEYKATMVSAEEVTSNVSSRILQSIEQNVIYGLERAANAAYDMVKTTEDSMTDISRVLGLTANQTENMREQMFGLGQDFGRSFEDVSAVTLRFAQAGYDMADSVEMSKTALLALNTAELDVENGTQSLIGIISQWGMEASDLITVIDKLNYTADNNAITTQDLVDGLLKASSMAKTAGMSFDDTVGVLTAMKVASGAAGKEVGNAFKSIMAYIQRPESLKLFDDMGIDVFADKATGELLPMMQILEGMTNKWNTSQEEMLDTLIDSGDALQMMSEEWAIATNSMDEYTQYQNAMAEATDKANTAEARAQAQAAAGVFRRNYYISLMENFNDAVRISDELINAEGHSMAENGRYMETLTAKVEQLITALTELAVTAADAGLLDLAKNIIDVTNQIVRLTSENGVLIPSLVSLAGVFLTIRSADVATEIGAIANSFGAAADTIVTAATAARTAETTMRGAAAGAITLNSALGAIGLAVTGISLIVSAVKTVQSQIHETRMETIEAGKEAAEQFTTLRQLQAEYNELQFVVERTAEEEERYAELQDKISQALGTRAAHLENLKKGTEEYTKALNDAVIQELVFLEQEQKAAVEAANKEYKSEYSDIVYDTTLRSEFSPRQFLADEGIAEKTVEGSVIIEMTGNLLEDYATISEAMNSLNAKASELAGTNYALYESFTNDEMYQQVKKVYADMENGAQEVIRTNTEWQQTNYMLANGIPKTVEEQKAMEDAIVSSVDSTGKLRDQILQYVDTLGTVNERQINFYDMLNDADFEHTAKQLETLSRAGTLTSTSFSYTAGANSEFIEQMNEIGVSTDEAVIWLNELYSNLSKLGGRMGDAGDETKTLEEELKELAESLKSAESNISSLNGYIQQLNEGNGLTAQQVIELCDTYGLLAEQFTLTENGYTIEISALEQLRDAQSQAAISARINQLAYTDNVVKNILQRIQAYTSEVKSIQTVADAQIALMKLETERDNMARRVNSADEGAKFMSGETTKEIDALIEDTQKYTDTITTLEEEYSKLYENIGKTFEKAGDSTGDVDSGLDKMISNIERFADMGVYSVEEVIARFEEWRRTMDLGAEDLQKLEDKLHALYAAQIEEGLKATEEQFNDAVDAIEKEYDTEKEELEKTLDEESELRKKYWDDELDRLKDGLNTEIDNAKKAYEEKKKLTQKSYDSQIEALENLRNTEIENIESTYNAQIEALKKIKAARQAQRNEEDYEAQRAELLEQISYWEQRTGTEAVENLADLRKQLDELDRDRKRELEDEEIENQISDLESRRDNETAAAEKSYAAQIAALKSMQEQELELYESTYNAQVEMLEKKLESEVKAMEERRDKDLKLLEEEHEQKLTALEDEKNAAIAAEEEKWAAIQAMFTEGNIALIASAAEFAPQLYQQFHDLFTEQFKMDLGEISDLINEMSGSVPSLVKSGTGSKPTEDAPTLVKKGTKSLSSFTGGSGFAEGDRVSVTGEVYTTSNGARHKVTVDGEKGNITDVDDGAAYPYKIGNMGWVSAASLVQARTGGLTTADGIAMLHRDELIVNPELVKGLKAIVDPKLINAAKMAFDPKNYVRNTYNNNTSAVYGSSDRVQNNSITINNTIEDSADANAVIRKFEREMSRKLSKMM